MTAVAEAIVGTNKTLGILPLGTVNRLAQDLAIPLGPDKAIGVLATLNPVHIDVAEVNGRVFLHNVTIGLMPRIALVREQICGKRGISPKAEFVRYFLERLSLAKRLAIEVDQADGPVRIYRAQW